MTQRTSHIHWRRVLQAALISLVATLALALLTHTMWLSWIGNWLAIESDPRPADAIVALGSNAARANLAADLYLEGLAPEVWLTGDAASGIQREIGARAMARHARERGVPESAMLLLESTSTWEDGEAIAATTSKRGADSVIVVTNWYHSRRSMCVMRQQLEGSGVDVFYAAPPDPSYGPQRWWMSEHHRYAVLSEIAKLVLYWPVHGLDLRRC